MQLFFFHSSISIAKRLSLLSSLNTTTPSVPHLLYVLASLWKCTAVQSKKGRQGGDPRGGSSREKGRQAGSLAISSGSGSSSQQMRACNQRIHGGHQNEKDLAWSRLPLPNLFPFGLVTP